MLHAIFKNKLKTLTLFSFLLFFFNAAAYYTAYAQFSGNQTSSLAITRIAAISLVSIPGSFTFKAIRTPGADRNLFSDLGITTLPITRRLTVQDNRGKGGFTLQVNSKGFVDTEGNVMPNSVFSIVSTPNIDFSAEKNPHLINTVIYENGFTGDTNISTPIHTDGTDFGVPETFEATADQNVLKNDKPVDILNGTLPETMGRKGRISVGLTFKILTRAFTKPNSYTTNLTYTLVDSTTGTFTEFTSPNP